MTTIAPGDRSRRRGNGDLEYDPREACRHLARQDPVLARLMRRSIPFALTPVKTQSIYHALAESIVYQQLSGKAASTIFGRFVKIYRPKRFPVPQAVLDTDDATLRSAGLSRNKVLALRDLSAKVLDGTVPGLAVARRMPDEELIERLTAVRGIGVWTVEMLLMFRLGRPDVLPCGDLGVQKGFAVTYGLRTLPKPKKLLAHGERWRPFRSVASWYMWRALE
ncbi:MAG TPA: DNA-3-methyladenine glycosylase [Gemmatimonadales bacterium]|nr:DNA-3-methyladenine glycosylase [Gemmatimonadales bacterium]